MLDLSTKIAWTGKFVDSLPDSSFLYVEPGGQKDSDGRTVPRSKRHFPVRDESGKADLAHVRNAIARIPQSNAEGLDDGKKKALQARARRMLGSSEDGKTYEEPDEWKTGAPITVCALGYSLLDLSDRIAEEQKAMRLLGETTREGQRIRGPVREELKALEVELHRIIDWAETIERGDDGKAKVAWYKAQLELAQ